MLKSFVDRFWKAIRSLFLLSSLVSIGFLVMNRQAVMSLVGISPDSSAVAADGSPATAPTGADTSKLAALISAAAPDNARAQMAAGALFLRQEKTEEAMTAFRKALDAEPQNIGAHFQVGMILMKHKKPADAEKEFREAIRLDPEHTDSRFGLAAVLQQSGTLEEAAAQYREIIRLKPLNAEAHNNLGIVYDAQGSKEKALAEFSRALELDPTNETAKQNFDEVTAELKQVPLVVPVATQTSATLPQSQVQNLQDSLVLTNGRTVKGKITEKTDSGVWLEVTSGKVFFSNKEISEIKSS